jgi:hypothetical protein
MTKQTFKQVYTAADALNTDHGSVGFSVSAMLASAEVNAFDTLEENQAAELDFDAIALSTLSDILANSTDTAARAWFAAQGVRF